jgi:hypothetical protein
MMVDRRHPEDALTVGLFKIRHLDDDGQYLD